MAAETVGDIRARARELLDLVQLGGLGERYPAQLSGGQRQRVALARALAVEPQLLLLDEPFGALDAKVRKELRRWLRQLHEQTGLTSIFVTHDQEEALELADRVVVMDKGVIEQIGTPEEIYMAPRSGFVSGFVGDINSLPVTVVDGTTRWHDRTLDIDIDPDGATDGPARLDFRPHDVILSPEGAGSLPMLVTSAYGPTGIYGPLGRNNISSPGVRLEVKPSKRWDGFLFYRAAWLDSATDSFASTRVRDASGASGKFGGHQIEARARYWIVPKALRLDTGAAALFHGRFLETAPNTNGFGDTLYGYIDVTVSF